MKDAYERINILYNHKLEIESNQSKIESLKKFFSKKYCFFTVDANTAMKVLLYLGIPEEELTSVYTEMVSLSNYNKYMPKQRTILPDGLEVTSSSE